MKAFLRNIFLPAALAAAAIGAAFSLGRLQQQKLGEAEAIARAPLAPLPEIFQRAAANNRSGQNFLSRDEAVAALTDMLNGDAPAGLRNPVMNILSRMKPGEALNLAFEWPELQVNPQLMQQRAMQWARRDTKAALEWAGTLPPEDAQRFYKAMLAPPLQGGYFLNAPQMDAKIAAQYLDKLTDPADRDRAMVAITVGLTRTDPAAALDWLGQHATGDLYAKTATAIFKTLVSPELQTADMPDGTFAMPIDGKSNPAAAVTLLATVDDPALRQAAIGEIAKGWAQSDPASAVSWAANLSATDNVARATALNTIMSGWSVNDPAAAVAFVEKSGNMALWLPEAPALAGALALYDADEAWKFVQKLPEGTARDQALNNVLASLAPTNLSTAWDLAGKLPAGTSRDAALNSLVLAQAQMDPAKTVPLLKDLAEGSAQNIATRMLAKAWAAQDPQATATWINTLPPGTQHDYAVYELVPAAVGKDPAMALNWANTLADPAVRADFAQWVLSEWAGKNPAAALAALPGANLTDEQKTTIAAAIAHRQAKAK